MKYDKSNKNERNRAEEIQSYKTHLEQLKRVQDAGRVGYWAVYSDDQFLEWSPVTYKLFDLSSSQAVTYEDMLSYVHPEDKDWVDEKWQEATHNGKYAVVYRIISAEQKLKWIEVYGDVVFDEERKFIRALGIVRDITQQKEAEIKLQNLAESLERSQKIGNLGSWEVKSSLSKIQMNEEALAMFNLPTNEEISIDQWFDIIHPEDQKAAKENWLKTINNGGDYESIYRILVKENVKWIKTVGVVKLDNQGNFGQAFGVAKDITEHITQQENLRLAKNHAEAANKLKSQFLANMSHEIRTPLNGIIGFSDILKRTKLDQNQVHYMDLINKSGHMLMSIINDVLDFSKIEAGKLQLAKEKTDLNELINQVKELISYQAEKKNVDLWVKMAASVPRFVMVDALRLQQVLVNLMTNAVKFTDLGEIELSIKLVKGSSKKDSYFRFSVKDTGIGISPENQDKIFNAFTQEDLSTTKKFGGTGLGLSISNGILELMDSSLQLESKSGEGSVFFFDVVLDPVEEVQEMSGFNDNIQESEIDTSDLTDLTIKVLIVDDNEVNMFLAKIMVKEILPNAEILEAEQGKIAVELYEKERPDLILMDIQMPVMNGFDASKKIRELEKNQMAAGKKNVRTPIVALSAATMKDEESKTIEVGMDDFMSKPLVSEEFSAIVKKWIVGNAIV